MPPQIIFSLSGLDISVAQVVEARLSFEIMKLHICNCFGEIAEFVYTIVIKNKGSYYSVNSSKIS